jgi:hypothetical protein
MAMRGAWLFISWQNPANLPNGAGSRPPVSGFLPGLVQAMAKPRFSGNVMLSAAQNLVFSITSTLGGA